MKQYQKPVTKTVCIGFNSMIASSPQIPVTSKDADISFEVLGKEKGYSWDDGTDSEW